MNCFTTVSLLLRQEKNLIRWWNNFYKRFLKYTYNTTRVFLLSNAWMCPILVWLNICINGYQEANVKCKICRGIFGYSYDNLVLVAPSLFALQEILKTYKDTTWSFQLILILSNSRLNLWPSCPNQEHFQICTCVEILFLGWVTHGAPRYQGLKLMVASLMWPVAFIAIYNI